MPMVPVDVDELVRLARGLMPPEFVVLVNPSDLERVQEAAARSPYAHLLEVMADADGLVPDGKCVLMRKDTDIQWQTR